MPTCCTAHDGPHVHGCVRPRHDGATHAGACQLPAGTVRASTP